MSSFLQLLARDRALPLVSPTTVDAARRAADVAQRAGLGTLEVALRTDAALAGLSQAARPDLLVGAGTVCTAEQVDRAVAAGAAFIVTPGFHPPVVERCLELGVPVLPGISTAGEAMAVLALGLTAAKLFPAAQLGGPAMARALAGPFPALGLVPSGGVAPADAQDYLALPNVLAVSGSWVLEASG